MNSKLPADGATAQSKLRFAIICHSVMLYQWQAGCLGTLLSEHELSFVIVDPKIDKFSDGKLFSRLNRFIRPRALNEVDMSSHLRDVPTISINKCNELRPQESRFRAEDIAALQDANLDFILCLIPYTVSSQLIGMTRYGVWSFCFSDIERYGAGPPCFWEMYNNDDVISSALLKNTHNPNSVVILRTGHFANIAFSYGENLNTLYLESAEWPNQIAQQIMSGAADVLQSAPTSLHVSRYKAPTNTQVLRLFCQLFLAFIKEICRILFQQTEWNIGVVSSSIDMFLDNPIPKSVKWLPSPKSGSLRADPFAYATADGCCLLFEHLEYSNNKGKIYSARINGHAVDRINEEAAIELPVHMSYPFIFEHERSIYCIPETSKAREIALYKLDKLSNRWEKTAVLIENMAAVDATIFFFDDRWWLTCGNVERGENTNLFVFHAQQPAGPWTSHIANPVKTDIRSSRPAGTPFIRDGKLYRPAQDCTRTYGRRVVLNEIVELTPTTFKEMAVTIIEPPEGDLYSDGLHTLSGCNSSTFIDGKRFIFNCTALRQRGTFRKLARIWQRFIHE